jgi:CheY-like chemotaxis protein
MMIDEQPKPADRAPSEPFVEQVKLALEHLYDFPYLQRHPLARSTRSGQEKPGEMAGHCLRRELLAAMETLNPGSEAQFRSPQARLYNVLHLHYVEGYTIQETARELGLSLRQAYRDLRSGEESVAAVLWAHRPAPAEPRPPPPNSIQAELAHLATQPRPTDMCLLVGRAQKAVEKLAQQRGVVFRLKTPSEPLVLSVDETAARQVVTSVLSRLVQQARPGIAHVRLFGDGELVVLALRYILDAEAAGGAVVDSIVAKLIEHLGWTLGQDDQRDGSRSVALYVMARGSTILVIDDNEGLVQLVERYLTGQACRVLAASNGPEGVELAQELAPDAIVLDVMMPGMDGWEVLQALRSHPRTAAIPVIVCSVFDDPELAHSLGASFFLPKPVSRDAMLSTLHRLRVM